MNTDKLLSPFQFIGSSIKKVVFDNTLVELSKEDAQRCKYDVDYAYEGCYKIENSAYYAGTILLTVNAAIPFDEKSNRFNMEFKMQGCYAYLENKIPEQEFEKMICTNGCAALYSIARSTIMSMSSQLFSSGKLNLPTINCMQLYYEKNNAELDK